MKLSSWAVSADRPGSVAGEAVEDGDALRLRAEWRGTVPPASVRLEIETDFPTQRVYLHGYGTGAGGRVVELPFAQPEAGHSCVVLISEESCLTVEVHDHRDYGTTLWVSPCRDGIRVSVSFDTAGAVGVGKLPDVVVREAPSLHDGLVRFAQDVAREMRVRPPGPPMRVWCSWYYHFQNFDEATLETYLDGFAALPDDVRPEVVQIDAGYFPSCGDWLETNHRWPSGLARAAEAIRARGFRAGIWIGPFMVGNRSRLFREHPDWMLRDEEGALVTEMRMYGEQRLWGLVDEEYYVLDASHPDALAYLEGAFRQLRAWGFDYFKTDFMYWGFRSSRGLRRHTSGSGTQHLRSTLDAIRQAIGDESTWLACIAPFAPFLGYADAMRVGGDVVPNWRSGGPNDALVELLPVAAHMNGVWWLNDPDAVILRDFHTSLSREEAHSLAMWQGLHAGVLNTSDPLHLLGPERMEWWRKLCGFASLSPASPLSTSGSPILAAKRTNAVADGMVVAINPSKEEAEASIPVAELALPWNVRLPPHESILRALP